MKKDDLVGFIGAAVCFGLSAFDVEWGVFWLAAGFVLLTWSCWTTFFAKRKR